MAVCCGREGQVVNDQSLGSALRAQHSTATVCDGVEAAERSAANALASSPSTLTPFGAAASFDATVLGRADGLLRRLQGWKILQ